jgi:UDP-glucose 4-epimerase
MTHVLVTGGAGFIGSSVADAYLARGWRVTILDDFSTGRRENVGPRAELIEADINDAATVDLVRSLRPDVVSHHAAQIDVRVSVSEPARDAMTNVVATIRLAQVAAEIGVQRFVFASTGGAIYGEPIEAPQSESHPARPLSPYGCAKLSAEHYLEYFRVVHGLPAIALRYANVYGPRQNPKGEAGVIAIFTERMLRGDDVTINGTGDQTRDYVFIDDVVAANLAVTDLRELPGPYNVGTGVETDLVTLHAALASATGATRAPNHGPAKPGEQMRSVIDGTKLRAIANLPEPVELGEGVRRTVEWFRDRR